MLPIPYGRQYLSAADLEAVQAVLQSDYLTTGPAVAEFEAAFAEYVQAPHAVAVSSGTAALHLCALALGVQPGHRVLCTPLTFAASANCVLYAGGEIDFVDIDPATGLMDLDLLEKTLSQASPGTYQGIITVDYGGHPVDLERVSTLALAHGCWLLQDACHAPGGFFTDSQGQQQHCGNGRFADLAIFSFHPVKHIACGEGGMITTRSAELAHTLRKLRNHGITRDRSELLQDPGGWYYEMQQLGYNYRLSDIHAALGRSQLSRAEAGLARRRALAARYDTLLADMPLKLPPAVAGHAYHLYVVRTPRRMALYDYLRQQQIYAQVHYIPVHLQPYYQQFGWLWGDLPQAEAFYEQCLSLPLYASLTDAQQEYVGERVGEFWANYDA